MDDFLALVDEELEAAASSPERGEIAGDAGPGSGIAAEGEERIAEEEEEEQPPLRRKGKEHSRHRSGSRKRGSTDDASAGRSSVKRKTSDSGGLSRIQFPVGMSCFDKDFAHNLGELCQTTADASHWEEMDVRNLGPSLVGHTAFLLGGIYKLSNELESAQKKAHFCGEETTRANMATTALRQAEEEIASLKSKLEGKEQELEEAHRGRQRAEAGKAKSDELRRDAALSAAFTIGDYRALVKQQCEEHFPGSDFGFIKNIKTSDLKEAVEKKVAERKKKIAAEAAKKAAEEGALAVAHLGGTSHQGEGFSQDAARAGLVVIPTPDTPGHNQGAGHQSGDAPEA